jgi:hypothetical protein
VIIIRLKAFVAVQLQCSDQRVEILKQAHDFLRLKYCRRYAALIPWFGSLLPYGRSYGAKSPFHFMCKYSEATLLPNERSYGACEPFHSLRKMS